MVLVYQKTPVSPKTGTMNSVKQPKVTFLDILIILAVSFSVLSLGQFVWAIFEIRRIGDEFGIGKIELVFFLVLTFVFLGTTK